MPVYFSGSQFLGKVVFEGVQFHVIASFREVQFLAKRTYFTGARFNGEAHFEKAQFLGEGYFPNAYFKVAFFTDTIFQGGEGYFPEANFHRSVDFRGAQFHSGSNFSLTTFEQGVDFSWSEFHGKTFFRSNFNNKTYFNYVTFDDKEKVIFDIENLSNVSFMNTDLTGVRFRDEARWGGKKVEYDKFWGGKKANKDRFKIVDERLLEEEINKEKDGHTTKGFNLGSIKAVYRNLRENYEYRMRYDEAGQFFIREMELKRKYREVPSKEENNSLEIKQNNWFRRNLLSLTGWYFHLSRYGESLWRPTLAGGVIVILSTLFWLMQSNPTVEFSPSTTECNSNVISDDTKNNISRFIGLCEYGIRNNWLKAFERSLADFLPLLPTGDFKMGIIDFVIKIIGGAVTFGLIAIALRRRFERRYRH